MDALSKIFHAKGSDLKLTLSMLLCESEMCNTYCLCLYDVALWVHYFSKSFDKFRSCYNRCLKLFFGYIRYDSVTCMLSDINLPSFELVFYSSKNSFFNRWNLCANHLVTVHRTLNACNLLLIVCLLSLSCFMCVFISFLHCLSVCLSLSLSPTVSVLWVFNLK